MVQVNNVVAALTSYKFLDDIDHLVPRMHQPAPWDAFLPVNRWNPWSGDELGPWLFFELFCLEVFLPFWADP